MSNWHSVVYLENKVLAALFIIVQRQKQSKGIPTDGSMNRMWHVHNGAIPFSLKTGRNSGTYYNMAEP